MKVLSLYIEKDSLLHRIDPITKLIYILTVILIPMILAYKASCIICLTVSTLLLILGKVFKRVIPLVGFSFIVLISVIIIQGLFKAENKTPILTISSVVLYKEGLMYAFDICLRVLNILFSFALLVLTTKPSDLIESLVRKGLSPKFGYILSSILQIIPQMTSTVGTITDAQRSRGMETEGKLIRRVKAFFPLIGPVVMSSLISTRERAMALEVRGFNSNNKKTFLNEELVSKSGIIIRFVLLGFITGAVMWRILK